MNNILRKAVLSLTPAIDLALMILAVPAGLILLLYRRIGSRRLPMTTGVLKKLGVFPVRNHYYEPLFDDRQLSQPLDEPRPLPGIDFDVERQLALLTDLRYADEFQDFVREQASDTSDKAFRFDNASYESGDADFLFQIIRHFQPSKVIEIGSGSSTKVARRALSLNAEQSGRSNRHICIEPYEQPWLESFGDIELIRQKVEDCDIDWSEALGAGDLLFIDSSHIIRPQGDVLFEYLTILPQLSRGVIVHVHDIFSPRDYLDNWVRKDVRFWNEQYLLEATLGNSSRYEILAALNMLKRDHYAELERVCPFLERNREPGSFYFRVR
jgi:hypothetical protein